MGVYINMNIPENCSDCPMCYDGMECTIADPIINFSRKELEALHLDMTRERHPLCPLVEVLECHDCKCGVTDCEPVRFDREKTAVFMQRGR